MQSITVRTRLRSADRPATWGAARGTGINDTSSTTDSTAAAGSATRSWAMVTTSSSSFTCPSVRCCSFSAPRSGALERHQQSGAVVAVDAEILLARGFGFGTKPDRLVARLLGQFLTEAGNHHIGLFVLSVIDHTVTGRLDQWSQHVLHPWIPVGNEADQLVRAWRSGCMMVGEQPMRIDQLRGLIVDQGHSADLARPLGMDDVMVDCGEVDHLSKRVADFMQSIVQPEQTDLIAAKLLGARAR